MKRIVAILSSAVILITTAGMAEEPTRSYVVNAYKAYCEAVLNMLCVYYDENGGNIDDDYVELTYKYYRMWNAVSDVYRKELQFDAKDMSLSGTVFGIDSTLSSALSMMNKDIEERWTKYVEGELGKAEFMRILTSVIKAQLKVQKGTE